MMPYIIIVACCDSNNNNNNKIIIIFLKKEGALPCGDAPLLVCILFDTGVTLPMLHMYGF